MPRVFVFHIFLFILPCHITNGMHLVLYTVNSPLGGIITIRKCHIKWDKQYNKRKEVIVFKISISQNLVKLKRKNAFFVPILSFFMNPHSFFGQFGSLNFYLFYASSRWTSLCNIALCPLLSLYLSLRLCVSVCVFSLSPTSLSLSPSTNAYPKSLPFSFPWTTQQIRIQLKKPKKVQANYNKT